MAQATDNTVKFDFDGDGKTDIAVYRPGEWTITNRGGSSFYYHSSLTGEIIGTDWGLGGDRPTPADFDGDGKTDFAIFRSWDEGLKFPWDASDYWIKYTSGGYSTSYFKGYGHLVSRNFFGGPEPERGVFGTRLVEGGPYENCFIQGFLISHEGNTFQKDITEECLNYAFHRIPALGDYNNDGISDIAIFVKPATTTSDEDGSYFQIWNSPASPGLTDPDEIVPFNVEFPIPGDYDGDGKTDFAGGIIENNRIVWRIRKSSDGMSYEVLFGLPNDRPVPADYDGDGKTDIAVARPEESGILWYVLRSSDGAWQVERFGQPTDIPITSPNAF